MLTLSVVRTAAPPDANHRREVNVWHDAHGAVSVRLLADHTTRWIDWPGLGLFAFSEGQSEVRVWAAPSADSQVLQDVFARRLQPVVLQTMGYQALHASASVAEGGIVAFCGRSGTGKSTLAYALQHVGWTQAADDALTLTISDGLVLAHPLPFQADLRASAREHLGQLAAAIKQTPDTAPLPLRLVILLRQDVGISGSPQIRRITGPESFQLLLTHAHAFDPEGDAGPLARDYLTMAAVVPVVELAYRPEFARLPELTNAVVRLTRDIPPLAQSGSAAAPAC